MRPCREGHDDGAYKWHNIADLPLWLVETTRRRRRAENPIGDECQAGIIRENNRIRETNHYLQIELVPIVSRISQGP